MRRLGTPEECGTPLQGSNYNIFLKYIHTWGLISALSLLACFCPQCVMTGLQEIKQDFWLMASRFDRLVEMILFAPVVLKALLTAFIPFFLLKRLNTCISFLERTTVISALLHTTHTQTPTHSTQHSSHCSLQTCGFLPFTEDKG